MESRFDSSQEILGFVGEELRLLVCGYIRPEAGFTSLEALVQQIHDDARVSELSLAEDAFALLGQDDFLQPEKSL